MLCCAWFRFVQKIKLTREKWKNKTRSLMRKVPESKRQNNPNTWMKWKKQNSEMYVRIYWKSKSILLAAFVCVCAVCLCVCVFYAMCIVFVCLEINNGFRYFFLLSVSLLFSFRFYVGTAYVYECGNGRCVGVFAYLCIGSDGID